MGTPLDEKALPAYRESLLVEERPATQQRCGRRCQKSKSYHFALAIIIGLALIAMGVMFLGGWFVGSHHGTNNQSSSSANQQQQSSETKDAYQNALFYQVSDGSGQSMVVPVIAGAVPITDFIQCNFVNKTCMSGNPVLTPKGKSLLTLYQYNGQVSVIATSTGANYGDEQLSTLRRRRRAAMPAHQYTLKVDNCSGSLMHPVMDDYRQINAMKEMPLTGASSPVSFDHDSSHTTVMQLANRAARTPEQYQRCHISLHDENNNQMPWYMRGYDSVHDRQFGNSQITLQQMNHQSDMSDASSMNTLLQQLDGNSDQQNLYNPIPIQIQPMNFPGQSVWSAPFNPDYIDFRKRRSVPKPSATGNLGGMMFRMFDQVTKKPKSTVLLLHDKNHGGVNGTMTYDITNHMTQCRSRFTMLFHKSLSNYDGQRWENVSHHQTFQFHYQNAAGARNMSMWQSVTPYTHKASSDAYPLVGQRIPDFLPCFTDELQDLHNRLKEANKTLNANLASSRQTRSLSWSCGLGSSLEQGYGCGKSAYECGSDIAEGDVTFGLSLFKAAYNCYDAGDHCYHFLHNCLH